MLGRQHGTLTHLFVRYAVERTNSFINVWFWARDDESVPSDVADGWWFVDTDNWVSNNKWSFSLASHIGFVVYSLQGTPFANFPNTTNCDLASHFDENNIIINLTLCT